MRPIISLSLVIACGCAAPLEGLGKIDMKTIERAHAARKALLAKTPKRFAGYWLYHKKVREHLVSEGIWSIRDMVSRRYLVRRINKVTSTLSLSPSKNWRLKKVEAVVRPVDGPAQRFTLADMQRVDHEKGRSTYKLAYPQVKKGAIIEERFLFELPNALEAGVRYHRVRLSKRWPAAKVEYHEIYPRSWRLQAKLLAAKRRLPITIKKEPGSRYRASYVRHDMPALPKEPYAPNLYSDADYLATTLQYVEVGHRQIYRWASWKELAKTIHKNFVDKSPVFSKKVKETTTRIIAGAESPLARLRAIARFLQNEISVDKSGQWTSRDFSDVLQDKRGARVQVAGLAVSMMRQAGLDASYIAVHSGHDGHFDPKFVDPAEIDYPAALVKLDGKKLVVVPYLSDLDAGVIYGHLQGKQALLVAPDGSHRFIETPILDREHNSRVYRFEVALGAKGEVRVHEQQLRKGIAARAWRKRLRDKRPDERARELWKKRTVDSAERVKKPVAEQVELPQHPLTIDYLYEVPNATTVTPQQVIFRPAGIFEPTSRSESDLGKEKRARDVYVNSNRGWTIEVVISYPKHWTLQTKLPAGQTLKTRYGQREEKLSHQAQKITWERTIRLERRGGPAKTIKELRDLVVTSAKSRMPPLVFKTGK